MALQNHLGHDDFSQKIPLAHLISYQHKHNSVGCVAKGLQPPPFIRIIAVDGPSKGTHHSTKSNI